MSVDNTSELFENCTMTDEAASFADVLKQQIDVSLDLLRVAKELGDDEWREALMIRLRRLISTTRRNCRRKSEPVWRKYISRKWCYLFLSVDS